MLLHNYLSSHQIVDFSKLLKNTLSHNFFKKCAKLFPNGNSTKISRGLPTPGVTCKAEYKMLSNNIRPAPQKLTVYEKTHKQIIAIQCNTMLYQSSVDKMLWENK